MIYLIIYVFVGIVTFVILQTKFSFNYPQEAEADAYISIFWIATIPTILILRTISFFRKKKETKQYIKTFKFGR